MKYFALFAALIFAMVSVPSMSEFNIAEAVGPPAQFAPYDDANAFTGDLAGVSGSQAVSLGAAGTERAERVNYVSMTASGLVSRSYARIERNYAVEVGGWPS